VTATDVIALLALGSIALFVVGLKRLSRVRTARSGNALMAAGMLLAVVLTLVEVGLVDYRWIVGGLAVGGAVGYAIVARAQATQMPEIVAGSTASVGPPPPSSPCRCSGARWWRRPGTARRRRPSAGPPRSPWCCRC
jgi:NAD/NADP transhydrogenase beta subunit